MKTCPVCSETYSERIDFCFNDGEVLTLMPSAMDAPMPRLAGISRSSPDPTSAPPVPRLPNTSSANAPSAADVPEPRAQSSATAAAAHAPPPERPQPKVATSAEAPQPEVRRSFPHDVVTTPTPPEAPAPKVDGQPAAAGQSAPKSGEAPKAEVAPPKVEAARPNGDRVAERAGAGAAKERPADARPEVKITEKQRPKRKDEDSNTPVAWFLGAFMLVLAMFVLGWALGIGGGDEVRKPVTELRRPEPPSVPVKTEPATTPAPAPAPVVPALPPAAAAVPVPAPAIPIVPAVPEKAPEVKPPDAEKTKAVVPPQPPQVVAPTTPAPSSPWDAPQQASLGKTLISSDPPGAAIRIDGKSKGTTPLEIDLPYGTYSVELDLSGYQPLRKRIDVQSPSPKFPVTLQREVRRGPVLVVLEGWDSATLEDDGEIRGQLPANIVLSEGTHTIVVRGERGEVKLRREVTLKPSGLTQLLLHQ